MKTLLKILTYTVVAMTLAGGTYKSVIQGPKHGPSFPPSPWCPPYCEWDKQLAKGEKSPFRKLMIYSKDNSFTLSNNVHSLGLQNNMTTKPTFGSTEFLNELATFKNYLGVGAQKRTQGPVVSTNGRSNNVFGR